MPWAPPDGFKTAGMPTTQKKRSDIARAESPTMADLSSGWSLVVRPRPPSFWQQPARLPSIARLRALPTAPNARTHGMTTRLMKLRMWCDDDRGGMDDPRSSIDERLPADDWNRSVRDAFDIVQFSVIFTNLLKHSSLLTYWKCDYSVSLRLNLG